MAEGLVVGKRICLLSTSHSCTSKRLRAVRLGNEPSGVQELEVLCTKKKLPTFFYTNLCFVEGLGTKLQVLKLSPRQSHTPSFPRQPLLIELPRSPFLFMSLEPLTQRRPVHRLDLFFSFHHHSPLPMT